MIETRDNTTPHATKIRQVEAALARLIADASQRGFHGTVAVNLSVQDGHIQHIRLTTERMIR
jgi:hypothetical protein